MKKYDLLIIRLFIILMVVLGLSFSFFVISEIKKNSLLNKQNKVYENVNEKTKQYEELNEEFNSFDTEENKELKQEYENWKRQNEKLIDVLS